MYIPEKGRKPPEGATEAELCAPVLGLDASARSSKAVINPSLSSLGPPGGDKRSVTEASLFLKAILTSSLGRGTSIVNRVRFLPLAMIDTVTSRKNASFFFDGREIACIGASVSQTFQIALQIVRNAAAILSYRQAPICTCSKLGPSSLIISFSPAACIIFLN